MPETPRSLSSLQREFAREISLLITHIYSCGYEVTFGDAYRDPRLHGEPGVKLGYGHSKSCHKLRLAVDLNLFRDGQYLSLSSDHKKFGEWWKARSPYHAWGGDFDDGNHYSFTYQGMK